VLVNAHFAISFTLVGILIVVNLEQPANALVFMVVTVDGIVTLVIP